MSKPLNEAIGDALRGLPPMPPANTNKTFLYLPPQLIKDLKKRSGCGSMGELFRKLIKENYPDINIAVKGKPGLPETWQERIITFMEEHSGIYGHREMTRAISQYLEDTFDHDIKPNSISQSYYRTRK